MTKDAKPGPSGPPVEPSVQAGDRALVGLRVRGRYRVVSELGAGALGTVCLAEDEATGHGVALRLLPGGLSAAQRGAHGKQQRSIVSASTFHPALVHVLEFGEAENRQAFAAMELVEGRRLSEILTQGPLDVDVALRLGLELGGAVEILHRMGLVHGAIRPCNVMMLADGRVKLMDLELIGLRDAKVLKGLAAPEPPAEYLSPEQIRRVEVTEKTDIYSFGILLYEMLCGVPPFHGDTREAILAKHLTNPPTPVRRRRRTIPASVEAVVALALYKQADLRPPMHNVVNRLWAEAHAPASRWKRTAAIAGGAAVAASVAALLGWGHFIGRAPAPVSPAPSSPLSTAAPERGSVTPKVDAPIAGPRPSLPAASPAPASRRAEAAKTTPPAVPPAAAPAKAERREPSKSRQVPAEAARERPAPASEDEAYDPGAVIDWMLRSRGQ